MVEEVDQPDVAETVEIREGLIVVVAGVEFHAARLIRSEHCLAGGIVGVFRRTVELANGFQFNAHVRVSLIRSGGTALAYTERGFVFHHSTMPFLSARLRGARGKSGPTGTGNRKKEGTALDANERKVYWRHNITFIIGLLVVWSGVSIFSSILFVETLNKVSLGNVPFGFWMAQQGSILVFVVIVFVYAWYMDRLDKRYIKDDE
jgi:putative solute:sodium symporter small subunit